MFSKSGSNHNRGGRSPNTGSIVVFKAHPRNALSCRTPRSSSPITAAYYRDRLQLPSHSQAERVVNTTPSGSASRQTAVAFPWSPWRSRRTRRPGSRSQVRTFLDKVSPWLAYHFFGMKRLTYACTAMPVKFEIAGSTGFALALAPCCRDTSRLHARRLGVLSGAQDDSVPACSWLSVDTVGSTCDSACGGWRLLPS